MSSTAALRRLERRMPATRDAARRDVACMVRHGAHGGADGGHVEERGNVEAHQPPEGRLLQ